MPPRLALSLIALALLCPPLLATEDNFIQMRGQKIKLKDVEASRTKVPPTPRDNIPSARQTPSESPDPGGGIIEQARDAMKSMLQKQNEQEKLLKELDQQM
jgi:hypothetical protein